MTLEKISWYQSLLSLKYDVHFNQWLKISVNRIGLEDAQKDRAKISLTILWEGVVGKFLMIFYKTLMATSFVVFCKEVTEISFTILYMEVIELEVIGSGFPDIFPDSKVVESWQGKSKTCNGRRGKASGDKRDKTGGNKKSKIGNLKKSLLMRLIFMLTFKNSWIVNSRLGIGRSLACNQSLRVI